MIMVQKTYKITQKQWNEIHKDYKTTINGVKHCFLGCIEKGGGTVVVEVEIIDEKVYTMADWKGSFDESVPAGSLVDEDIYMYFLEVLPPAFHKGDYFQVGEPHSHRDNPKTGKYAATFATFDSDGPGRYRYYGNCFLGERVNIP